MNTGERRKFGEIGEVGEKMVKLRAVSEVDGRREERYTQEQGTQEVKQRGQRMKEKGVRENHPVQAWRGGGGRERGEDGEAGGEREDVFLVEKKAIQILICGGVKEEETEDCQSILICHCRLGHGSVHTYMILSALRITYGCNRRFPTSCPFRSLPLDATVSDVTPPALMSPGRGERARAAPDES
ncbi:hypothetical protein WMY93_010857 [Mugilogobius chulae]|uniref:Uncharacterized protein n=1 Tax=Mugilogobius chulae TaxID=88201 RepID=A0AAW0PEY4_9GOBI